MTQLPITWQGANKPERKKLGHDAARVLEALREGPQSSLTLERIVGTRRAAARVYDLKALGHTITSEIITSTDGVRCALYRLETTA